MAFEVIPEKHPEADSKRIMCGSCQWFSAGFGKTCQTTRGVAFDALACREFTVPLEDPYFFITQDKYIQGIREVFRSNRFKIDASILEEIKSYIVDDNFNKYKFGTTQDLESINNTLKKIIQFRARISNLYTSMLDIKHEFDELMSHSQLWLISKYAIIRELKSESLRKIVFLRLLPEMIHISKNIEKNLATAKYVENHLECNEQTLIKILNSSEKLWFSRERVGGPLKGFETYG
jgi:hypothetical protein